MGARDGHHTVYLCESWGPKAHQDWKKYYNAYSSAVLQGVMDNPYPNIRVSRAEVDTPPKMGVRTQAIVNHLNHGFDITFNGVVFDADSDDYRWLRKMCNSFHNDWLLDEDFYDYPFSLVEVGGFGFYLQNHLYGPYHVWSTLPHLQKGEPDRMLCRSITNEGTLFYALINLNKMEGFASIYDNPWKGIQTWINVNLKE